MGKKIRPMNSGSSHAAMMPLSGISLRMSSKAGWVRAVEARNDAGNGIAGARNFAEAILPDDPIERPRQRQQAVGVPRPRSRGL
jgi:hypothetical protein